MHCIMHTVLLQWRTLILHHSILQLMYSQFILLDAFSITQEVQVYGFILCVHTGFDAFEKPISAYHRISRSKSVAPGKCDLN